MLNEAEVSSEEEKGSALSRNGREGENSRIVAIESNKSAIPAFSNDTSNATSFSFVSFSAVAISAAHCCFLLRPNSLRSIAPASTDWFRSSNEPGRLPSPRISAENERKEPKARTAWTRVR